MSTEAPTPSTYIIPPPSGPNWKTPLLVLVLLGLIGSNVFLFTRLQKAQTDNRADLAKLNTSFTQTLDQMRAESLQSVQNSRRTVRSLEDQLNRQRAAADRAVGQAKVDAQKQVESLQSRISTEQQKQQQAIDSAKQSIDTANTKIETVSTDVQNTKGQLEQTVANLRRVAGDVDNHSSLIATNGKELDALKALGERNYTEFKLTKSKEPSRVGDLMVQLKKSDLKRNRFTIEVTADDKKVEKKDRTVNEPIQFYTSKAKQPYEIVVNQVGKDTISGYLAIPKVLTARN